MLTSRQSNPFAQYNGSWDNYTSETERQAVESAFVDVLMMAAFDRNEQTEGQYGWDHSSAFTKNSSSWLASNTPERAAKE